MKRGCRRYCTATHRTAKIGCDDSCTLAPTFNNNCRRWISSVFWCCVCYPTSINVSPLPQMFWFFRGLAVIFLMYIKIVPSIFISYLRFPPLQVCTCIFRICISSRPAKVTWAFVCFLIASLCCKNQLTWIHKMSLARRPHFITAHGPRLTEGST